MRFSLYFDLAKEILPTDMNRAMVSFIKKSLTEAYDGNYYDQFFCNTEQKPYSFAISMYKPVFKEDCIEVARKQLRVTFSVFDSGNGYLFVGALLGQKQQVFPLPCHNKMVLTKLSFEPEERIEEDTILVRTAVGGGICVRNHDRATNKDRYSAVGDDTFMVELNEIVRNELQKFGIFTTVDNFKVELVKGKKVIAKHFGLMIPITVGFFLIKGEPKTLQALLALGMGSRRSQGFGKIDIVKE